MNEVDESAILKLSEPIGKKVHFQYPGSEGHKTGVLKDRVIMSSGSNAAGVAYWDVVDLIEFPGESEPSWIRIGYYRKPRDRFVWGSQTTITEPIKVWKRLLVKAAREKAWFRELLLDVIKEIQGDREPAL